MSRIRPAKSDPAVTMGFSELSNCWAKWLQVVVVVVVVEGRAPR